MVRSEHRMKQPSLIIRAISVIRGRAASLCWIFSAFRLVSLVIHSNYSNGIKYYALRWSENPKTWRVAVYDTWGQRGSGREMVSGLSGTLRLIFGSNPYTSRISGCFGSCC